MRIAILPATQSGEAVLEWLVAASRVGQVAPFLVVLVPFEQNKIAEAVHLRGRLEEENRLVGRCVLIEDGDAVDVDIRDVLRDEDPADIRVEVFYPVGFGESFNQRFTELAVDFQNLMWRMLTGDPELNATSLVLMPAEIGMTISPDLASTGFGKVVVVAPEDARESGGVNTLARVFELPERETQLAGHQGHAIVTLLGLWSNMAAADDEAARYPLSAIPFGGPESVRFARSFSRIVDAGPFVDEVTLLAFDPGRDWPNPDNARFTASSDSSEVERALKNVADSFAAAHRDALGLRQAYQFDLPEQTKIEGFRQMFRVIFASIRGSVRRVPGRLVSGFKYQVASFVYWKFNRRFNDEPATLFGFTFPEQENEGGDEGGGREAESRERDALLVRDDGDVKSAWRDMVGLSFALIDGGHLPEFLEPQAVLSGDLRLVVANPSSIAPDPSVQVPLSGRSDIAQVCDPVCLPVPAKVVARPSDDEEKPAGGDSVETQTSSAPATVAMAVAGDSESYSVETTLTEGDSAAHGIDLAVALAEADQGTDGEAAPKPAKPVSDGLLPDELESATPQEDAAVGATDDLVDATDPIDLAPIDPAAYSAWYDRASASLVWLIGRKLGQAIHEAEEFEGIVASIQEAEKAAVRRREEDEKQRVKARALSVRDRLLKDRAEYEVDGQAEAPRDARRVRAARKVGKWVRTTFVPLLVVAAAGGGAYKIHTQVKGGSRDMVAAALLLLGIFVAWRVRRRAKKADRKQWLRDQVDSGGGLYSEELEKLKRLRRRLGMTTLATFAAWGALIFLALVPPPFNIIVGVLILFAWLGDSFQAIADYVLERNRSNYERDVERVRRRNEELAAFQHAVDAPRLRRRYREYLDWAEFIGWNVHRPVTGLPETSARLGGVSLETEKLPAALEILGCDAVQQIVPVADGARAAVFTVGWLGGIAEGVMNAISEDQAKRTARGMRDEIDVAAAQSSTAVFADLTSDPTGARTRLLDETRRGRFNDLHSTLGPKILDFVREQPLRRIMTGCSPLPLIEEPTATPIKALDAIRRFGAYVSVNDEVRVSAVKVSDNEFVCPVHPIIGLREVELVAVDGLRQRARITRVAEHSDLALLAVVGDQATDAEASLETDTQIGEADEAQSGVVFALATDGSQAYASRHDGKFRAAATGEVVATGRAVDLYSGLPGVGPFEVLQVRFDRRGATVGDGVYDEAGRLIGILTKVDTSNDATRRIMRTAVPAASIVEFLGRSVTDSSDRSIGFEESEPASISGNASTLVRLASRKPETVSASGGSKRFADAPTSVNPEILPILKSDVVERDPADFLGGIVDAPGVVFNGKHWADTSSITNVTLGSVAISLTVPESVEGRYGATAPISALTSNVDFQSGLFLTTHRVDISEPFPADALYGMTERDHSEEATRPAMAMDPAQDRPAGGGIGL